MNINVYLAGPSVFKPDAEEIGLVLKQQCARAGFVGCYPLDNEANTAEEIRVENLGLIKKADVVIADVSPFRGEVEPDSGTVFEIGYADALEKPIFLYSENTQYLYDRVASSVGISSEDTSRDVDGNSIETHGLNQNLMFGHHPTFDSFERALDAVKITFSILNSEAANDSNYLSLRNVADGKFVKPFQDGHLPNAKVFDLLSACINNDQGKKLLRYAGAIESILIPKTISDSAQTGHRFKCLLSSNEADLRAALKSILIGSEWVSDIDLLKEHEHFSAFLRKYIYPKLEEDELLGSFSSAFEIPHNLSEYF